jgi:SAM-dependent methyltransferase
MKPHQEKPAKFDDYARDYDALLHDPIRETFAAGNRFFFERKIQVIRHFLKEAGIEPERLDWLDIGCGQGDLLQVGKAYFRSAAGCDPSEGMLRACTGLEVRKQDSLDKIPFDDASFDFLTAVCVYHHVPPGERQRLTREALRVLKPAGIFCVIEHNPWNVVTRVIVSRTPVDVDANLLSAAETRRLLSEAGSRIRATRYFLIFPKAVHRYLDSIEAALSAVPLGGQYSVFAEKL